jgi:hypothetical protein
MIVRSLSDGQVLVTVEVETLTGKMPKGAHARCEF